MDVVGSITFPNTPIYKTPFFSVYSNRLVKKIFECKSICFILFYPPLFFLVSDFVNLIILFSQFYLLKLLSFWLFKRPFFHYIVLSGVFFTGKLLTKVFTSFFQPFSQGVLLFILSTSYLVKDPKRIFSSRVNLR